eukprot:TRINITY_DN22054_c0_g1_i1.p1 TRINITY_DN22054_c0_g1~~TRINITY_DN22054_c0_g1_i1.p1  ORF type:complete len:394 (+),score=115.36 TRINITY_DN22054_c0_g1_i1:141-1322(+)
MADSDHDLQQPEDEYQKAEVYDVNVPLNTGGNKINDFRFISGASAGSDGVFAVKLNQDGVDKVLVVKGGGTIGKEALSYLFAGWMAKRLRDDEYLDEGAKNGVQHIPPFRVPSLRMIGKGEEFSWIIEQFHAVDKESKQGLEDARITKLAARTYIIVLDFIKGASLDFTLELPKPMLKQIFPLVSKKHPEQNDQKHENPVLHQIGEIILLDMLINNWDRFPLEGVWDCREGNPKNLMITTTPEPTEAATPTSEPTFQPQATVIDQMISPIRDAVPGKEKYLNSVKKATRTIWKYEYEASHKKAADPASTEKRERILKRKMSERHISKESEVPETVASLRGFIEGCTQNQLTDDSIDIVCDGFIHACTGVFKTGDEFSTKILGEALDKNKKRVE